VSEDEPCELVLTAPAQQALTGKLPETVAAAVIEFLTTALIQQPVRAGKPLRDGLTGIWSARRGTYRVLYRIRKDVRKDVCEDIREDIREDVREDNTQDEVIVLRVEHRRDAYHPF
jgi:mRNA interferase RelE/StbE